MDSTNVVEVRDLAKRYRGTATNAVDRISFDVSAGQFFCLLGPNGAGKTTTLSILTTILLPTSGTVHVAGLDVVTEQAAVRGELGIVFQDSSLDLNLTAEENIRLHAVLYGLYTWRPLYRLMPGSYKRRVEELAGVLGIGDILGRRTRSLSGGMRRKLEIVRALLHAPRILFLDEPTAGLAPEARLSLWDYLREARVGQGTTIFLTTHYLEEAEDADMVCIMAGGKILQRGSPAQIKSRFKGSELVLDGPDRATLHRELRTMGLAVDGDGPWRLRLDGRSAQSVIRRLDCELTTLQTVQTSLEDAYLNLLKREEV